MGLIRFFAKKSIFVNLIAVFVTVMGFIIFFTSPKEIFPNIEFGVVVVNTFYPQAAPDEVEKLVTSPIEDAIQNVNGVKEFSSASSEGVSMIIVQAEEDYNIERLKNDIENSVGEVDDLPDEADDPDIFDISSEEISVIMLSLSGGRYEDRRETAKIIEEKLTNIKGVSSMDMWGYSGRAIWVDARKGDLKKYSLTVMDLMRVLGDRNISMPAGNKKIGRQEYAVRFLSEQKTDEEISRIIVRSNEIGRNIRIGDVAKVGDGFEETNSFYRTEGEDAILLQVRKSVGYDAIKLANEVKKAARGLEHSVSDDVTLTFTDDFSERLKDRMEVLYSNGLFGACLVILMLLLLLRPSVALVTAVGLPVALGTAFLLTHSIGITVNMISLFGFIMVIGMLVDDAIVVGENAYRYIEKGLPPFEAAVKGTQEMIMPVIASVSTTISAFMPLLMVGGMMGEFMGVVPKVVSIALAASVIECFFILPSHVSDFVKNGKKGHGRAEEVQEHWFEVFKEKYGKALGWVLNRRVFFSVLAFLVFVSSVVVTVVKNKVFSDTQVNEIQIKFETPSTFGTEDTNKVVENMEDKLLDLSREDMDTVIAFVGYQERHDGPPKIAPNLAHIRVLLQLEDDRKTKDAEIIVSRIKKMIGKPENVNELNIDIVKGGPGQGEDIKFTLTGDSYDKIEKAAKEIMKDIKDMKMEKGLFSKETIDPVLTINTDLEEGKKEIRLVVDEAKAARTGVSLSTAASMLRAAIAGLKVKSVKKESENIDIMVRIRETDIKTVNDILSLKVPNNFGKQIPMRAFVKYEKGTGYSVIKHQGGRKSVSIIGTVDKKNANVGRVNMKIMEMLEPYKNKYSGIKIEAGGEFEAMNEAFADLAKAFIVALAFIFIILATLFNSLVQPLVIMLAIPLGFIGVVYTLVFHGEPISFMAFMGMVGLAGVVVNNSLILVKFINNHLAEFKNKNEAVIEAAKIRLRPVILTTITTSVGLFPLAYGWFGGDDPFLQPMALVFAWGLIFASSITLFIIPSFLVIANNLRVSVKRILGRENKSDYYLFKESGLLKGAVKKTVSIKKRK